MNKNKHSEASTNETANTVEHTKGLKRIAGRYAAAGAMGLGGFLGVGGGAALVAGHNEINKANQTEQAYKAQDRLETNNLKAQAGEINTDNQKIQQYQQKIAELQSAAATTQSQESNLTDSNKILASINNDQGEMLQQDANTIAAATQSINNLENNQSGLEKSFNQTEANRLTNELNAQGVAPAYIINGTVTVDLKDGSSQSYWDPIVLSTNNGQNNVGFSGVTGIGIQVQTDKNSILIEPININQPNTAGVTFNPNKPLQASQPDQTIIPIYALTEFNNGNAGNVPLVYAAQLVNGRYDPLLSGNEVIYPGTLISK